MKWTFGVHYVNSKEAEFKLWSPFNDKIALNLIDSGKKLLMERKGSEILSCTSPIRRGERYKYELGGVSYPDPASYFQPEGVHGPSQVIDHSEYKWVNDTWKGLHLEDYVIYELHTGTFSPEGTYRGIEGKLNHLSDLGITCIEIMPVGQFPGTRNWGYDVVSPYAPQNTYGTVKDLKHLVDTIHSKGLSAIMDVVYNHLGPEGNYLPMFGPYFTEKYSTPWGKAINYDDAYSDMVRRYIVENALYWLYEFRFDALRLDAIHGIFDFSPTHILKEISTEVEKLSKETGREMNVIAESDLNDPVVVRRREKFGYGMDAQWSDDFHHSLHAYLTGERNGYYSDFGNFEQIVKALRQGFVYDGIYSGFRRKSFGGKPEGIPLMRFLAYSQNHDQVGNRAGAERLLSLVGDEKAKLAAAMTILSPFTPLLFMGEEYGERAPFNYFISTDDIDLAEAVKAGRTREFKGFGLRYEMDPNDRNVFEESRLEWKLADTKSGKGRHKYYRDLIEVRKEVVRLRSQHYGVESFEKELMMLTYGKSKELRILANLSPDRESLSKAVTEKCKVALRSTWKKYGGGLEVNTSLPDSIEAFEVIVLECRKG